MRKFLSPYEKEELPVKVREISSHSETIPDQSLGIKEILRRSMAGIPSVGHPVFYDGDSDDYDDGDYDLTDVNPEETAAYKQSVQMEKLMYGSESDID